MESTAQQTPPNGWQYRESKTNTTVIGATWKDLISAVTNHRKHNGIESGDVEEEIRSQIKENYPDLNINI